MKIRLKSRPIKNKEVKTLENSIKKNIKKRRDKKENIELVNLKYEIKELTLTNSKVWNKVIKLVVWEKEYYWEYALHKILNICYKLRSNVDRMKTFTDKYYINNNK